MSRGRRALGLALVGGVTCAVYAAALDNPFVYDDHHAVLENEFLRDARHLGRFLAGEVASSGAFRGHIRPLPIATLYLNHAAGGIDPFGYRLVNLLLHLGCAALAFAALRRLLRALPLAPSLALDESEVDVAALVAVSLFALHPMNSLSVLLVWKRTTLFATGFMLLGILAFSRLRGIGGPPPRGTAGRAGCVAGLFVSYAAALASKETAVALPALVLLLELWPRRAPSGRPGPAARIGLHAVLWIGVVLSLTVLFPEPIARSAPIDRWTYLAAQAKAIWLYAAMIVRPDLLSAAYDLDARLDAAAIAGGAGILALLAAAVAFARRTPLGAFAVLWALVALAPTSSFVPGPQLVDEDRTYLPFLPLWAVVGTLVARGIRGATLRRVAVTGLALGAGAALALATTARGVTWNRDLWIWLDAVERYPRSKAARVNLCVSLAAMAPRRMTEALAACRAAMGPEGSPIAVSALARVLLALGRYDDARREVAAALARAPTDADLLRTAGHVAWAAKEHRHAAVYYRRALARNRWDRESLLYLADCLHALGRRAEALERLRELEGRPILDPAALAVYERLRAALAPRAGRGAP